MRTTCRREHTVILNYCLILSMTWDDRRQTTDIDTERKTSQANNKHQEQPLYKLSTENSCVEAAFPPFRNAILIVQPCPSICFAHNVMAIAQTWFKTTKAEPVSFAHISNVPLLFVKKFGSAKSSSCRYMSYCHWRVTKVEEKKTKTWTRQTIFTSNFTQPFLTGCLFVWFCLVCFVISDSISQAATTVEHQTCLRNFNTCDCIV